MNEYLTELELGKKLSVSRSTLYSRRKKGLPYRKIGRLIRYLPEEVEAWLSEDCLGQSSSTDELKGNSL